MASCIAPVNLPAELEQVAGGAIRFRGTRIGLDLVLGRFFARDTLDEIHARFPTVSVDALQIALAYVQSHDSLARAHLDQQQALARLYCDDAHRGPTIDELRSHFQAGTVSG